jgi:tetratricopeptide (TPR) repeat protein
MEFYEEKKQPIVVGVGSLLLVVCAYFGYNKMIKEPNEEKAATALSYPQLYYQADSLNLALNGDGRHNGFLKLAKQYDGTDAGNLANYYAGVSYLKSGDYANALKFLQNFNGRGTLLAYQAWGAMGQAYMETGNKAKAIEFFKKASDNKDDILLTPMYLYQLGLVYEANGQPGDAKSVFKRIKDEYPKSMQARDMEKELAKLGEIE